MKRHRPIAVLLSMAVTACDGAPPRSSWSGQVVDSAGVAIVVNDGGTVWGEGDAWRVVEDLVIGPEEARPETLFGHVADLAVDGAGRIYVLDQQAQMVRVFDPDGVPLRTLGGPGEGPGELGRFAFSVLARADTILVVDWGQARISRFGTDGALLSTERTPVEWAARSWWSAGPHGLLFRSLSRYTDEAGRWQGDDVLWRYLGEGRADTLLVFDYSQTDIGVRDAPDVPLILNTPSWAALPDGGIAWLALEEGRIRIHDAEGALRRIVASAAWRARAPSPEETSVMVEKLGEKLEMLGGSRETVERIPVVLPERLPAVTSIHASPDGILLIQRMGAVEHIHPMALNTPDPPTGWGGDSWDVLDREGRLLGSVTLPGGFRLFRITQSFMYGVRRGALDVDEVVRLRVERP